jgi:alkylation response protein AidB-like acyl-CoA dehydrogenase
MAGLLTAEEEVFQSDVRAFCQHVASTSSPTQYYEGRGGDTRKLYQQIGERGWLHQSWPVAFGGAGKPVSYDFLLWNELAYWRLARPDLGPGIVAHLIIEYGSAEQRDRFLPDIAAGRSCYSLGYSEPDAGSDLAGLTTRARRSADCYVVDGEKCWTSDAHHAQYLWLLVRTGSADSRARGLTLLICPTDLPGLSIAPIRTMDGHRLNLVRLDEVRIPVNLRVGPENEAWTMIRQALAVERHLQLLPGRARRDLEDLFIRCEENDLLTDQGIRERLAPLVMGVLGVEASALTTVRQMISGIDAALQAARTRLIGSRLLQDISRAALELLGEEALVADSIFELMWRETIMETIAGGTSEILEGLIARQGLQLGVLQ